MKKLSLITLFVCGLMFFAGFAHGQAKLPHGTTFGTKPDTTAMIDAAKLNSFMGEKKRISIALKGKVAKVTAEKGGWFLLETAEGQTIEAHFKDYRINLPAAVAGRTVIIEGVAKRWFPADDGQHYAGDTIQTRTMKKEGITLEVSGLMVYK